MEQKHIGLSLGAVMLAAFLFYIFQEEVASTLMQNYSTVSAKVVEFIPKLITIILIFIIAKLLLYLLYSGFRKYFKYVGKEKQFQSAKVVVKYTVWILAIIAMLSVVMGDLGVWLTSVGLVGFGVTFALQKPILNFVGWITIMVNRTYTIGDRVEISGQRGDVLEIQMMYTVLDGLLPNTDEPSGKVITLPNELILTSSNTNFTKSGYFLWDELSVDITYESDWKKGEEMLKEIAYEVVNKYVKKAQNETSEKQLNLEQTLRNLRKSHRTAESKKERNIIKDHMDDVNEEKEKIEGKKKEAQRDRKKEPIVRIELKDSSVSLNVRYIAYYKNMRMMKSEINTGFLEKSHKTKNVEIAYPHLQIVQRK